MNKNNPTPQLLDGQGRHCFIAGLSGGIGGATAELFAAAGATVSGGDIAGPEPRLEATDEQSVRRSLADAVDAHGPIDFLINAVGVTGDGPVADMSTSEWERVIAANLTSSFLLAREGYTHLRRPGGVLVMLSSTNGRNGGTLFSGAAYGAAKAAILNLARGLAKEWAGEGLRVNCVAPGPVATPMLGRLSEGAHARLKAAVPLGRYAEPGEIAAAIAFLCSDHAKSMTGAVINISGGLVLD